jgi:hypothetical protein
VVFERGPGPDAPARDCDISFGCVPFRPFARARRPPAPTRTTAIVPNFTMIRAAIRFAAMPAPRLEGQRRMLIEFLRDYDRERLVLLLTAMGTRLKGVYLIDRDGVTEKLWGAGPARVVEKDVESFWKYVSAAKQMEMIPTKYFTQTTDSICLKRPAEPKLW